MKLDQDPHRLSRPFSVVVDDGVTKLVQKEISKDNVPGDDIDVIIFDAFEVEVAERDKHEQRINNADDANLADSAT